jgi:hypothetical protein
MGKDDKDVYIPPPRRIVNVNAAGGSSQSIKDAEEEIKVTRARRQLLEERQLTERILNPNPGNGTPQGFTVTGGIDLGKIDINQERKEAKEQLEKERTEMRDNNAVLAQELEETKAALVNIQIDSIRKELQDKVNRIEQLIANGNGATNKERATLSGMLAEAKAVAKELGYGPNGGSTGNDMVAIELARLNNANAAAERDFRRQMETDRRNFEIKMEEIKNDREMRLAELGIKKQQGEMLASIPERIGEAIGRSIAGRGEGGEEPGTISSERQDTGLAQHIYKVEAGVGESGAIDCPTQDCGSKVAVGPKATTAVCANCGSTFEITRVGNQAEIPIPRQPVKSFMDVAGREAATEE